VRDDLPWEASQVPDIFLDGSVVPWLAEQLKTEARREDLPPVCASDIEFRSSVEWYSLGNEYPEVLIVKDGYGRMKLAAVKYRWTNPSHPTPWARHLVEVTSPEEALSHARRIRRNRRRAYRTCASCSTVAPPELGETGMLEDDPRAWLCYGCQERLFGVLH
jgi:hypothetical protein